jgi:hypothetical protein
MVAPTAVARFPDCERKIQVWPLLQVGEELLCPHCEADLAVVSLDPVKLDWAFVPSADDDDWDDKWDDEDEDD